MGEPKKGCIFVISWQCYSQLDKGNICRFPHGSSADHALSCSRTTSLCEHSNPSCLWSALWKQVSNQSCCHSEFNFMSNRNHCCHLRPKAAWTSILRNWNIFLVILWPLVSAHAHLVYSRFVYMARWSAVRNHRPQNPFLSFSTTVFLTSSLISSFSTCTVVSVRKPPSFCHVWEWQGSPVKLTPISIQSEAGPGPRPAVPKSICLPVCQARLLPWPLKSPLVMEHFQSLAQHWSKLWCTGQCSPKKKTLYTKSSLAGPSLW